MDAMNGRAKTEPNLPPRTGPGRAAPFPGRHGPTRRDASRRGAASLDYILLLGVVLPMIAFILGAAPRIIRLAYEMVSVLISWPFM
jgi:hypothetical protein